MEEQHRHDIAERLRRLRDDSEETNRSVADFVGVGERTVAGWLSPTNPAGISYKNAKKVAELFEADVDWLWRGKAKGDTPDLLGDLSAPVSERLEVLEQNVEKLLGVVETIRAAQVEAELAQDEDPPHQQPRRESG